MKFYVFVQSIEARCQVENEDLVWAVPTGDAPTTSEWQCLKLSQKSCRSSCFEYQMIINMKLKKNQQKVPGPPQKLPASDRRTCGISNTAEWSTILLQKK